MCIKVQALSLWPASRESLHVARSKSRAQMPSILTMEFHTTREVERADIGMLLQAALFILLTALAQGLLCRNVYFNPLVNPSHADLEAANAKLKAEKTGKPAAPASSPAPEGTPPPRYDAPAESSDDQKTGIKPELEFGRKGRKSGGKPRTKTSTGRRYQEI